ncbi:uncharacterized protein LOC128559256 [Mercenaria mercenaria]|uniref:uncharacterized protein LOC128559256 n=1 Tax=Mercenaria mercenaria TaxID=6596 RepID=UPI00234F147F|nr:uncharacterized protein LOC128559256 [Mercenaria mercenaria]
MSSPKQVPTKFNPGLGEGVYDYFIRNYLTHWFEAKTVPPHVYTRAMNELVLLNKKKKSKQADKDRKVTVSKQNIDSEREEVTKLGERPSSASVARRNQSKQEQASGSRNVQLENDQLKSENLALQDQLSKAYMELQDKATRLHRMKEDLKNSLQEVNDLKIRLSKLYGDKLRDNNPDLADQCDANRPTELGKRFLEIYDNEWSDAFENKAKKDEKEKVGILHEVVVDAFYYCNEKFKGQVPQIRGIFLQSKDGQQKVSVSKNAQMIKSLNDLRMQLSTEAARNVAQEYSTSSLASILQRLCINSGDIDPALRKYAFSCAEICWLLLVWNDQLSLSEDKEGVPFDQETYKPFTRRLSDMEQPTVEFVVWPALCQEFGVLVKGVAQPKAGKRKPLDLQR